MAELGHVEIMNAVVDSWRSQNIDLNPGADEGALTLFEMSCGTRLPKSFRYLYSLANGMDGGMDDRFFTMWSFEEILKNKGVLRSNHNTVIYFGDFSISSHRYYLLMDQTRATVVADELDEVVAESFEQFGLFLLTAPERLHL